MYLLKTNKYSPWWHLLLEVRSAAYKLWRSFGNRRAHQGRCRWFRMLWPCIRQECAVFAHRIVVVVLLWWLVLQHVAMVNTIVVQIFTTAPICVDQYIFVIVGLAGGSGRGLDDCGWIVITIVTSGFDRQCRCCGSTWVTFRFFRLGSIFGRFLNFNYGYKMTGGW